MTPPSATSPTGAPVEHRLQTVRWRSASLPVWRVSVASPPRVRFCDPDSTNSREDDEIETEMARNKSSSRTQLLRVMGASGIEPHHGGRPCPHGRDAPLLRALSSLCLGRSVQVETGLHRNRRMVLRRASTRSRRRCFSRVVRTRSLASLGYGNGKSFGMNLSPCPPTPDRVRAR